MNTLYFNLLVPHPFQKHFLISELSKGREGEEEEGRSPYKNQSNKSKHAFTPTEGNSGGEEISMQTSELLLLSFKYSIFALYASKSFDFFFRATS